MQETNLQTEQVSISELKPAEYNPRTWSAVARDGLTASLEEFGFLQPIVANSAPGRKGVVIGGNFKLDIAKTKGVTTLPVVWVNIPDIEKEKELNLRLNKNQGDFDLKLLADFDRELLEDIGFSEQELAVILDGDEDTQTESKRAVVFTVSGQQADRIHAALEAATDRPTFEYSGKKPKQSDSLLLIIDEWTKLTSKE